MSTLFFNFFKKIFWAEICTLYIYLYNIFLLSKRPEIKHHLPLYTDNRGNNTAHQLPYDISIFSCNLYRILLTSIPYFYHFHRNYVLLCAFSAVNNMYRTYKKFFLYQKSHPELVSPNSLQDFVYFLCCLYDTAVLPVNIRI